MNPIKSFLESILEYNRRLQSLKTYAIIQLIAKSNIREFNNSMQITRNFREKIKKIEFFLVISIYLVLLFLSIDEDRLR
jgi:hypothetical protein